MEPKKIKLPENEEELRVFLTDKSRECVARQMDPGLCYVNGFNAGMKYAMVRTSVEGKGIARRIIDDMGLGDAF